MKLQFSSPGKVDNLSNDLLELWNQEIFNNYEKLKDYQSRFFEIDFSKFQNPPVSINWFADPAETTFCKNISIARKLADWGSKGRQNLHNEYCEYTIIKRRDKNGNLRPKRVQFTTELREYWILLAVNSPFKLKQTASSVLGFEPSWNELYGVENPFNLSELQRKLHFCTQVAGNGGSSELKNMGVPPQPVGRLNTDYSLFMSHPINGLDDLLYIVMFGARPYAIKDNSNYKKASKEEIFRKYGVEHLACRHADPAAALGAYNAVFSGKPVGFADPIGMYIQSFNENIFSYEKNKIPKNWIKISRGNQRMVFGPTDEEEVYLDELMIEESGVDVPLTGGFQIAQVIEVGPNVLIGDKTEIKEDEYIEVVSSSTPIKCNEAEVCERINSLYIEYNKERLYGFNKPSFRQMEL